MTRRGMGIRRKPVQEGFLTVPMLMQIARKKNFRITRAHIENAINRGEIKGVKRDFTHKAGRKIFPIGEGQKFMNWFLLRQAPEVFVTVPEAIKIMRNRGVKMSRSGLEKIVDKGIHSGARLVFEPKHGRIISKPILENIIANKQEGKPATHGFEKPGNPERKVTEREKARFRKQNLKFIEKWLKEHAANIMLSKEQKREIDRIVRKNLHLSPANFHAAVIPDARIILGL